MKNIKGFTLIELLAVIVVLAIIALITIPQVLGMTDKAKGSANLRSIEGHIDNMNNYIAKLMLEEGRIYDNGTYTFNKLNLTNYPKKDHIRCSKYLIKNHKVVNAIDCILEEKSYCYGNEVKECTEEDIKPFVGPTKVAAKETDTHKGILYFDPTDLNKTCEEEDLVYNENGTTSNIKSGCMKWYIFKETDTNYIAISDHNVLNGIAWKKEEDNAKTISYTASHLKEKVDELVTVDGWKVVPRLLKGDEVYTIISKTGFNPGSSGSCKTLDTNTFDENTRNKYAWLFENTYKCKTGTTDYGCNIEDNYKYISEGGTESTILGYWLYENFTSYYAKTWEIDNNGRLQLDTNSSNEYRKGIRPVVTIDKSLFDE